MKKLFILLFLLIPSLAFSTTYYVRTDGNDSCNGTVDAAGSSGDCAKRTVQAGVNLASAGDTVIVHSGNYSSATPTFTTARAGSIGSPITIRAATGETVSVSRIELSHAYTIARGFRVVGSGGQVSGPGIWILASNTTADQNTIIGTGVANTAISFGGAYGNVTISNNIIEGSNTAGTTFEVCIRVLSSSNTVISGNTIRNLNGPERCFELYGSGITVTQNHVYNWNMTLSYDDSHPDLFQIFGTAGSVVLIERNYFHDLDAQIGNVAPDFGSQVWTFRNNIFANITQPMFNWITMYWYNNLFYNCASSDNSSQVILSGGYGGSNYLYNNAFVGCGYQDSVSLGWADVVNAQSNNFASTLSGGAKSGFNWGNNSINGGNPYFTAPYTNCTSNTCNFNIGGSSVFIDEGATIGSFSNDYAGTQRPSGSAWDIGPYEYGGVVTPDTSPPEISSLSPSGTVTCTSDPMTITESLVTSEPATAKWHTSDVAYASMSNTFTTTGGTSHSRTVSRACDATYTIYVRTQDNSGNANTSSSTLTYTIAAETAFTFISGTRFGENSSANIKTVFSDTTLSKYSQTTNYSADNYDTILSYPAETPYCTYLGKVDLSSIPTSATVNAAKLYYYIQEVSGDSSYEITAHKINGDTPVISTATWATYNGSNSWGATLGGLGDIAAAETTVTPTATGWVEITVTSMTQDWVTTPANNKGFLLASDQTANKSTQETWRKVWSSEYADASLRPMLIVDYTVSTGGPSQIVLSITGGSLTITPSGGTLTFTIQE